MNKHLIYFVCTALAFASCTKQTTHTNNDGHYHQNEASDENHSDEIVLTTEQVEQANLKIDTIKSGSFRYVIKTSGQILSAQGDEVTLSATTSGIVSFNKNALNEGANVKAGEILASISSQKIGDGDPILKARAAYDVAKREYDRAQSLIGDRLISEKEYNGIKLNYENAKVSYDAFASSRTAKGAAISSSLTGFIKSKLVSEGQYVEIGQPMFTVTQNRKLQLRADVSEKYYKDLQQVVLANFKTPYDNVLHRLEDMDGRLVSFGKSTSNQEFYVPVNFEFDNVGDIISGSYVEVFLLSQPMENVIGVPLTALIDEQGLKYVYLQTDAECFKKQEVKLGMSDGERIQIISGLKMDDKVVVDGAYHIKLASASSAIPHSHAH